MSHGSSGSPSIGWRLIYWSLWYTRECNKFRLHTTQAKVVVVAQRFFFWSTFSERCAKEFHVIFRRSLPVSRVESRVFTSFHSIGPKGETGGAGQPFHQPPHPPGEEGNLRSAMFMQQRGGVLFIQRDFHYLFSLHCSSVVK